MVPLHMLGGVAARAGNPKTQINISQLNAPDDIVGHLSEP